jgi:hypothetical protein
LLGERRLDANETSGLVPVSGGASTLSWVRHEANGIPQRGREDVKKRISLRAVGRANCCSPHWTCYAAGGGYLWTVDASAQRTAVGFMGSGDSIRGLSFQPSTGTLYGAGGGYLWTIDSQTAARTLAHQTATQPANAKTMVDGSGTGLMLIGKLPIGVSTGLGTPPSLNVRTNARSM